MTERVLFEDRHDAGRQLARRVCATHPKNAVVYALPRGGVPVACEVAQALGAPLDLLLVRKIGAPTHPEFGIGALVGGPAPGSEPHVLLNEAACRATGADADYITRTVAEERAEIERRRQLYAAVGHKPIDVAGRTAIVVDDGAATGRSLAAALAALRRAKPDRIVVALPVAAPSAVEDLRAHADAVICLAAPPRFTAVGAAYALFDQLSDDAVLADLRRAWKGAAVA